MSNETKVIELAGDRSVKISVKRDDVQIMGLSSIQGRISGIREDLTVWEKILADAIELGLKP
jgi:hypothetical protein